MLLSRHFHLKIPYLNALVKSTSAFKTIEPFFGEKYITRIENMSASSLLRHSVLPTSIRRSILSKIRKVSLVISHCDHPLTWIRKFTSGYEDLIDHVWVFSKCGQNVTDAPDNAQLLTLPNVGRCDHTYAYWIDNYFYNTLKPKASSHDIVVFIKDTDYMFDMKETDDRNFGDLLSQAVTNGLGCMLMISVVSSYIHDYNTLRTFAFDHKNHTSYKRVDGQDFGNKQVSFHNEKYRNLGEWIDRLKLHPVAVSQNIVPVCYGGVFAVTASQIARHSKPVWKAIEKSLSRGDNIIEGHYAERIWAPLLSKPFNNETVAAFWDMNLTLRKDPFFYRGLLTPKEDRWWYEVHPFK